MSATVLQFTGITTMPLPAATVLDGAKAENLAHVLVLGRADDGTLYAAATDSDLGEALLMVEQFKKIMLESLP